MREIHIAYACMGIESLVKTFDRGGDEKIDINEINRLIDDSPSVDGGDQIEC